MSKAASRSQRNKRVAEQRAMQRSTDRAVFATIIMVGGFGLLLWFLAAPDTWRYALLGFVLAVFFLLNYYTWRAVRGDRLALWQRSFARLPLRFAGFGVPGGKPLDAAKGEDIARIALYLSIAISVVLLLAISYLILPEFR